MIEKTRLSWIGLSFLLTTTVGDHHFSHNEQIEHRMADKLQARSSDPWPGLLLIKEDFFLMFCQICLPMWIYLLLNHFINVIYVLTKVWDND